MVTDARIWLLGAGEDGYCMDTTDFAQWLMMDESVIKA